MNNKVNVQRMAEMGLLTAIVLILAFTPLGYLKTPWGEEITFIVVPVAVGAVILGPKAGAFLGFVFGMTSFAQCFGASPMGAVLLQMNPVGTFVVCVVTRVFVGLLPALIYQMLKKIKIANVFSVGLCCFLTPLVNTILYITGSYLIFADAWMELAVAAGYGGEGGISLLGFMFAMVAVNGIVEAASCLVIATAVCKALQKTLHKN